ncbi:MAG: glycosyltransferase [Planctomycetes bacterium]|nr:glycosyltransferase [Planctomycetota bacterium]
MPTTARVRSTGTTSPDAPGHRARPGLRVAFAGGGTGGHVVPGLHLLADARARGAEPADLVWFTSGRPVEERVFAGALDLLAEIPHERLALPLERRGGGAPSRAGLVLRAPGAVIHARRALVAHRTEVLLGLGGFASLPAVVAARGLGIPVALLEVNAVRGAATRWLARAARRVLFAFEPDAARPGRDLCTGPPLSPALARGAPEAAAVRAARLSFGLDPERPVLLVLGGSQGASALNAFVRTNLPRLIGGGLQVLHQTGPGKLAEAAPPASGYHASEYFDPAQRALEAATVALCRAGASTLCEVAALRLPAFVAPYPRAADDHQARNARALGRGVRVVRDDELGAWTADALARLASASGAAERRALSAELERALPLDGAQRIWHELGAIARVSC